MGYKSNINIYSFCAILKRKFSIAYVFGKNFGEFPNVSLGFY